mgnify:CR=1 FL=1
MNGAEKLLGKGDMLFYPQGYQETGQNCRGLLYPSEEVSILLTSRGRKESGNAVQFPD